MSLDDHIRELAERDQAQGDPLGDTNLEAEAAMVLGKAKAVAR